MSPPAADEAAPGVETPSGPTPASTAEESGPLASVSLSESSASDVASESIRSDEIIPLLRKYFSTVDVRYTGGSVMQFALYDIAGNFYDDNEETRDLLDMLFNIEEVLVKHDDVPQDYAVIVAKNK